MSIKLYWWKGKDYPNLGDELSRVLIEQLFSIKVEHAELAKADLISVGSVLNFAADSVLIPRRKEVVQVVGSGYMRPVAISPLSDKIQVHSVRGYLSRNLLGDLDSDSVTLGDPGLLCREVYSPRRHIKYPIGVVLHHSKVENAALRDKFSHLQVKFIDIRVDDYAAFVDELAECEYIISESLHGLIIADAYGIPNAWLRLGDLHGGGAFKFHDYFSSVNRPFGLYLNSAPSDIRQLESALWESPERVISAISRDVRLAFEKAIAALL